jgi:ketosteroid isomerase-like protein
VLIEDSNASVLRQLLAAFALGDMDAVKERLAPDVRYRIPGRSKIAGTYQGPDEVLDLIRRVIEMTGGTLKVEVHDLLANEHHGVLLLRGSAVRGGKAFSYELVDVYHFKDGKIADVVTRPDDQDGFDRFYS